MIKLEVPLFRDVKLEEFNKNIEDTGHKKPNRFIRMYSFPIVSSMLYLCILIALFVFKASLVYIILLSAIGMPLILGSFGYLIVRAYLDRNRISNALVRVTSKNFIVANFWHPQRKVSQVLARINKDGKSFDIGDQKYTIDYKEVWYDQDKYPNSYYLPNLPNPLKINVMKNINQYLAGLEQGVPALDDDGYKINVSYSSENLQLLMKDKMFKEMHSTNTPEQLKLIWGLIFVIIMSFVAIIITAVIK